MRLIEKINIDPSISQDNLLLFNHARLMAQDNHSKEYLVSIMFSHYDQNNNGNLEREELEQVKTHSNLSFSHVIKLFNFRFFVGGKKNRSRSVRTWSS